MLCSTFQYCVNKRFSTEKREKSINKRLDVYCMSYG